MAFPDDALAAIQDTYNQLQSAFLEVAKNPKATPGQLDQLRQLVSAAGDAYWHAVAQNLADDNTVVTDLMTQLGKANQQIEQKLTNLQDVAQFIGLAAQAVQLAASIASLAAA